MYPKQNTENEFNKQPQPSCPPPSFDPYVSVHGQHHLANVPPAYSATPLAAYAPQQQAYGYPPPQGMGYYQVAPPPPHHGFYAAAPPPQQAIYFQQQAHPHHHQPQQHLPQQHQPQQVGPPPSYGGGPQYPTGYCPPPAYQAPVPMQHIQQVYSHIGAPVQKATYDSGARFSGKGGASMSIPPPPPGYAPNAAQMAAMKGQTVAVEKEKGNFFTGGKGAGSTFW